MVSTKEKKVPVPLELVLYNKIKHVSDQEDTSMAHVIRRCCREALEIRADAAAKVAHKLAMAIALRRNKTKRRDASPPKSRKTMRIQKAKA